MQKQILHRLLVLTFAAVLLSSSANAAERQNIIGHEVDAFQLHDFRGKVHSLSDYDDKQFVVAVFMGTECPLAKLYAPRLEELWQEFGPQGVQFLMIDSNQQDSITELDAFARINKLTFPVLKDPDNSVADQFNAERTPEVFVLDGERAVRYNGRIDDQYGLGSNSGYARPEIKRRDLAVALEELLAGDEVSVAVTPATGCIIGRIAKVDPHGDVTYSNQIVRLLQNRCVECHRDGEIGPFSLTDYDEVVGWAEMSREVIEEGRMPPWFADPQYGHFKNDARLTEEEKQLFYTWVENGCPKGDSDQLPPPREFAHGWQIGEPDLVVRIADEPYTVPAEGVVEYQYFTVDPGIKEDTWVVATEARPDNRAVVHHIIAFMHPPGSSARGGGLRSGLGGYAPGSGARIYPDGVGTFVPAGSLITFQMHYTPNGTVQQDCSSLGLKFADESEITHRADGGITGNVSLRIPPGDPNYEVTSKKKFRRDTVLVSLTPHMHLRGKAFRFVADYPDGTKEILLDVPKYDFNWQLTYNFAEPKLIPKGTYMRCTAHYDNSEDNLANPDPTEEVTFGDQTWEEMMFGFFTSIVPREPESAADTEEPAKPTPSAGDAD